MSIDDAAAREIFLSFDKTNKVVNDMTSITRSLYYQNILMSSPSILLEILFDLSFLSCTLF